MTEETNNETSKEETTEIKKEEVSLSSMQRQLDDMAAINKDLISSRDAAKTKLKGYEEIETAEKEKQGDFEKLYGELKTEFTSFKDTSTKQNVDLAILGELKSNDAKNPDSVLRLMDTVGIKIDDQGKVVMKSITEQVNALKESDPYLFNEETVKSPAIKRAAEENGGDTYIEELKAARANPRTTPGDLQRIRQKHGRSY